MTGVPIVTFPPKIEGLTTSEKKVLKNLILAAKVVASIYQKQENHNNSGANFYPRDATKSEIIEAAKKDPSILSPYTMVERAKNGKLVSIPYHIQFKSELMKAVSLIREAAKLSENKEFAMRLEVQANAL